MTVQSIAEDDVAIKTYRYLRIGMVVLVLLLGVSVVLEALKAKCLQTSISAYFYTPVQGIFVGGLIAIGVCLIVIKGSTPMEDICLNLAGMLAPLVAVAPTPTRSPTCASSTQSSLPREWVEASLNNNVKALLITGFAALIAAFFIGTVANKGVKKAMIRAETEIKAGLWTVLVILVFATALYWGWDSFSTSVHGVAAVLMFLFLAGASALNWRQLRQSGEHETYRRFYGGIAAAMIGAGVFTFIFLRGWSYYVLALEAAEIGLFAAFWLNQTSEHWNQKVRPERSATRV
jgi:uncharacterized membrane protein (GlpM family)